MARKYDVFLSYRRQGGEATAKIICDRLSAKGLHVFYDVEALRSGAFNTTLYSVIDECRDFIIVLSPDSLNRCSNENDWVRLEIAHALRTGKNVIPIFLRGFQFPEELPEDIAILRYQNGLEANSEFFDAFIVKLQSFLKSKPTLLQHFRKNALLKRSVMIALAILVGLILAVKVPEVIKNRNQTYPKTRLEKYIVDETFTYIKKNLSMMDVMAGNVSSAYNECENYLIDMNPKQHEKTISAVNMAYNEINKLNISSYALPEDLSDIIDTTPINKADLIAVNRLSQSLCQSYIDSLLFIKQVFSENSQMNNATRKKILDIYTEMMESATMNLTYGLNDLLLPINNDYLKDFKQKYLFKLKNLPFSTQIWLSNKDEKNEISRVSDSIFQSQEQQYKEFELLVGKDNYALMLEKSELEQYGHENGLSQNEIDTIMEGSNSPGMNLETLKQQLDEATNELKDLKIQAKEKFAPNDQDTPEILWGKMLRFLSLHMNDEAKNCAEKYRLKVEKESPEVQIYVPAAIRFIDQISFTGVDYGILVCAYEPEKPKHSIYEIGDIIIAINGNTCFNFDGYTKLRPDNEDYKVTILRPDNNNMLERIDVTVPAGQPKVQLINMTENEQE